MTRSSPTKFTCTLRVDREATAVCLFLERTTEAKFPMEAQAEREVMFTLGQVQDSKICTNFGELTLRATQENRARVKKTMEQMLKTFVLLYL